MMEKLYVLNEGGKNDAINLLPCEISANSHRDIFHGEIKLDGPINFENYLGKKYYDYILGSSIYLNLIHNKFFSALESNNVTGYKKIPTVIKGKDLIDNYSCLVVTGRAGHVDWKKGDVIDLGPMVPGAPSVIVKKGLYFNESTWDGTDFFLLEGMDFIIVTEKVNQIIIDLKLTNFQLTPIEELQLDIEALSVRKPELKEYYLNQLSK